MRVRGVQNLGFRAEAWKDLAFSRFFSKVGKVQGFWGV